MGVLACDRKNCDAIMCDFYSDQHGYLCYDCLNELRNGIGRYFSSVAEFMTITKGGSDSADRAYIEYLVNRVDEEFKMRE